MSPRLQNTLIAALLVVAVGLFAGAVVKRREADLRLVKAEVNFLRELILTLEARNGRAPADCGQEQFAWEALIANTPGLGDCGAIYMGREGGTKGRYWVRAKAGGVDFVVTGLARRGDEVLVVTASRGAKAEIAETRPPAAN
ncbi:hypothetical protein L6R49_01695 [Myxococcota bacterium]|nr:hypothetical protein [Myxococcota bacterium]